jgi:hypothetical protein
MKVFNTASLMMIGTIAVAGSAYAGQPPDVVKSDSASNTAMGEDALYNLSGGSFNTAAGIYSLLSNSNGSGNAAFGNQSLQNNTTGSNNTAVGSDAMLGNETGDNNTAVGANALVNDTDGYGNTAIGTNALYSTTYAQGNTAVGFNALYANTLGYEDTVTGVAAMSSNLKGASNTANGAEALHLNTSGNYNSAFGALAMASNTTGSNNTALGNAAGYKLTTGGYNIDIGNEGEAGESDTIRIGTSANQKATFIAGIYGNSISGNAVVVNSSGQLGVVVSSERFKTDIAPMEAADSRLQQLRPVTFHLKTEPNGNLQYGLIAEEVAKVYPDLVIRDTNGRIDGVRYDELAPLLLSEVQQQALEIRDLEAQVRELARRASIQP